MVGYDLQNRTGSDRGGSGKTRKPGRLLIGELMRCSDGRSKQDGSLALQSRACKECLPKVEDPANRGSPITGRYPNEKKQCYPSLQKDSKAVTVDGLHILWKNDPPSRSRSGCPWVAWPEKRSLLPQ